MSAKSERDDSERELFQNAGLARRFNSYRKHARARRTHPLRLYVFLAVLPDQEFEIPRGEHVDDDDGFGEEHDGKGDGVEWSRRYHLAGGRDVRHARRLCFSNGSLNYEFDVSESVIS